MWDEVYRMKKILVVDDEKSIVKGIKFSLEQDDMKVEVAYDGETALELAKANHYDMILLDIMLPGFSGLEVCQMIREVSDVPIIMLTAKGDDMDKILGLEYGADDYITKPFNILEVKARIKAIFRRNNRNVPEQENQKVIETKGLKIDVDSRRVYIDDKEVDFVRRLRQHQPIQNTFIQNGAWDIISTSNLYTAKKVRYGRRYSN